MRKEPPTIHNTLEPSDWAPPPKRMSFTNLNEIEQCPRRWSLMFSSYKDLWSNQGYPEPILPSAIVGRVIHRAIEILLIEFHRKNCETFKNEQAIYLMKELGGFTGIIDQSAQDIFNDFADNPRAIDNLDYVKKIVQEKKGSMREDIKSLLTKALVKHRDRPQIAQKSEQKSTALSNGFHTEVFLESKELKWVGVADLIVLSSNECEIRDIKSGLASDNYTSLLTTITLPY